MRRDLCLWKGKSWQLRENNTLHTVAYWSHMYHYRRGFLFGMSADINLSVDLWRNIVNHPRLYRAWRPGVF